LQAYNHFTFWEGLNLKASIRGLIMKKTFFIAASILFTSHAFAQLKPFVTVDYARDEKRAGGAESFSTGVAVGIKMPDKVEYSLKTTFSQPFPNGGAISNSVELKLKKSYDLGLPVQPYASVRLGEKFETARDFAFYGFDFGLKMPVAAGTYLDVGTRYRDAFSTDIDFHSWRVHGTVSYDFDTHNTVGLRYSQSTGYVSEAKTGWRIHYTYNY